MRYLIGVDDTDNLDSRGTGYHARQLANTLSSSGLVQVEGITRHQLLVDARIRYTSHNSSACLTVVAQPDRLSALIETCREYLADNSAPGSDAGLCVAKWDQVVDAIQHFGQHAKHEVLTMAEARHLAEQEQLVLEGLTGDQGGIIGALATVGLRAAGNDGRFLWLPGLRELSGIYAADQLRRAAPIELIQTIAGLGVLPTDRIEVGEWVRPLLKQGCALLLVEEVQHEHCEWRVIGKDTIKQLSN
ncbi:hypothetical protein TFLX_02221 [Thermoflexales bacterium]|nr:hypothetical protein TFLX_02221 [Thermoflexales bacterium]